MTDRITKHVSAMKEYGRKPYLVTKDAVPIGEKADYRYMMETTWHKAQDNEQIVVQSVKKKPYNNQDYQTMENIGDLIYPMTTPQLAWNFDWNLDWKKPDPFPANKTQKEQAHTTTSPPKWIQCPTTVGTSKSYVVIVKNASLTTKDGTTYYPTSFGLSNVSSDARGFSLSNVVVKNSVTFVTLTTSSIAMGSYYITAKSGGEEIKKKILVSSKESAFVLRVGFGSPYTYYKLKDLVDGNEIPYTVFTVQNGILLNHEEGSYTESLSIAYPDSYSKIYAYDFVLTDNDASALKTFNHYIETYYDTASVVSKAVEYGGYFALNPPQYYSTYIHVDASGNTVLWVENDFTRYYKYQSMSLIAISADYSFHQEYGVTEYDGTMLRGMWLIDSASYVIQGRHMSVGGIEDYHYSGSFMGSAYAFFTNFDGIPQFGSL